MKQNACKDPGSYIGQEWDNVPLQQPSQLLSSAPRRTDVYRLSLKEAGMFHGCKAGPGPAVLSFSN